MDRQIDRQMDGWMDKQTEERTDEPITRCPQQTFQAGGIKILFIQKIQYSDDKQLFYYWNKPSQINQ